MVLFKLIDWGVDLQELQSVMSEGFGNQYIPSIYAEIWASKPEVYFVKEGDVTIGVFQLQNIEQWKGLSSFCILPSYRGLGYGRDVISLLTSIYPNLAIIDCPEEGLIKSLYKGIPIIYNRKYLSYIPLYR